MTCDHIHNLLPLYTAKELDERRAREVATHIDQCERCARDAAELESVDALFDSVSLPPLPAGLSERAHEAEIKRAPRGRGHVLRITGWAVAAAVAALVITGTIYKTTRNEAPGTPASVSAMRTELGAHVVLRLKVNNLRPQELSFTVALQGGMRFLGKGLRTEERRTMRWSKTLSQGEHTVLIPMQSMEHGEADVVVRVQGPSGEVVKSLSFNITNQMVAVNHAPVVATIVM